MYHSLSASHDSEIKSVCLSRLAEIFGSAMLTPIQWKALTTEQSLYLNVPPTSAWNRVIWGSTNTGTLFRGYLNGAVQGGATLNYFSNHIFNIQIELSFSVSRFTFGVTGIVRIATAIGSVARFE